MFQSGWHQDFGVIWSKETLILWLQRPADVVSGTLSKQNQIWKFDLEFLTNFRPQKHQDRSETSDTELSISPTRPTRIHKVLHDLPWHGPPTGRKTGTTTSNAPNWDNLLQIYCNLLHLHSHSGLTIHVCRIWAIFNFDCVFWKPAFAFFSLHFTS